VGYEAFWIPGLDTDFGRDEALAVGDRWLRDSAYPGERLIVLHAATMVQNAGPLAEMATRFKVVAPRTQNRPRYRGSHAVLAVWASDRAMELAEELARPDGGLCLIPGSRGGPTMWIARTGAVNLGAPGAEPAERLTLEPDVSKVLDGLLDFGGRNDFYGAGEKEMAVRALRAMVAEGHRPAPDEVEAYAIASAETDYRGASHLRELYEGVLAGKRFRI
jgi:hypothetical protein